MYVNVNRITKNYLLLYKVTPQVCKILFLVYLANYSLDAFSLFFVSNIQFSTAPKK